jgi:glycosyltransferase involved in cell wall biosynthesis
MIAIRPLRILINLSTLKGGGGQNVAMNFLMGLRHVDLSGVELSFLVAKDSAPHRYLEESRSYPFHVSPRKPVERIIFERFTASRAIARDGIDIVYSYFGFGLFGRKVKQVSGSADSNLYFPEIDFWEGITGIGRLKKFFIDHYRIFGIKSAFAVVYENEALRERAETLFRLPRVKFIKPSIAVDETGDRYVMPESVLANASKALFLCGWQLNKNIMRIPAIAAELKRMGQPVHFVLTAPADGSSTHVAFMAKVAERGVDDMVSIVGSVDKRQLASLYEQVDFVMMLSKLESFSNNIIEAWAFKRPLIVASEDWARSICKDAAVYVDRNSPADIAAKLAQLRGDTALAADVVGRGSRELASYPTIEERIREELQYLKSLVQAGR